MDKKVTVKAISTKSAHASAKDRVKVQCILDGMYIHTHMYIEIYSNLVGLYTGTLWGYLMQLTLSKPAL